MTKSSASLGRSEVRREAALVADRGGVARGLQRGFQRVEDLGAHAHGLGEVRRADRRDHELLDVDRVVGMRPAIEDVHHRHRQQRRLRAAEIAVERLIAVARRGLGGGERHAENGVGAEPLLVLRAVEIAEALVDAALVAGIEAVQRVRGSRRSPPRPRFFTPLPP